MKRTLALAAGLGSVLAVAWPAPVMAQNFTTSCVNISSKAHPKGHGHWGFTPGARTSNDCSTNTPALNIDTQGGGG
ncbi:hypothetical protein [Kitasatospora camelliae]|uniref:Uncharacterized protein n=1 Tax=Kitasatospora camelliae TaxID=3156397 RepID=A0AAU8JR07_9ACTN